MNSIFNNKHRFLPRSSGFFFLLYLQNCTSEKESVSVLQICKTIHMKLQFFGHALVKAFSKIYFILELAMSTSGIELMLNDEFLFINFALSTDLWKDHLPEPFRLLVSIGFRLRNHETSLKNLDKPLIFHVTYIQH